MPIDIVIGTQWGDEGKGRIVDLISEKATIVARYSGGDNAGHTVTVGERIFKLHLLPSGIIQHQTICVLGNGMVVNPLTLLDEMAELAKAGIKISAERLIISPGAHLITPMHRLLDQVQDEARGKGRIGTTGRGIGPAYVDKIARRGIRISDLLDKELFRSRLTIHVEAINRQIRELYHQDTEDMTGIMDEYFNKALLIVPFIKEPAQILKQALKQGKKILAEGAQGTLLDIDHGSYPFVTSSTTIAPGIFAGLGIGIQPVERVIGVTKSFQTRVGSGPFPTEQSEEAIVHVLRGTGANPWDEFGTTTGRPRRVGWLDGILLKYAVFVNGITELAITKMDILSDLPEIKICKAYRYEGKQYEELPASLENRHLEAYEPIYESLPGWQKDICSVTKWEDLPLNAQNYIQKIEDIAGVPVKMISFGPERNQCLVL